MSHARQSAAVGRRIKAAIELTGLDAQDVKPGISRALAISKRTFDRVLSGERELQPGELELIARELDVPEWFLREGFNGQPAPLEPDVQNELLKLIAAGVAAGLARAVQAGELSLGPGRSAEDQAPVTAAGGGPPGLQ